MMQNLRRQTLGRQLTHEALVAIGPKGMPIAESIAGNGFSGNDGDRRGHGRKGYHGRAGAAAP
jgi:hypothetical protein